MYSIQLTIIVLHVLGNWLIDNTDEAGRLNDWFQKIYYSDVTHSEKNFYFFPSNYSFTNFYPFFPLANTISKIKEATELCIRMNLDVKKGVRA